MIIHNNLEQGSLAWRRLRLGKVTASEAHRLLTPAKFKTYFLELLSQQLTNVVIEGFTNEAMQWGIDQEPYAMEWYAENIDPNISVCAFVELPGVGAGCSPDLLVGDKGMAQIKCPTPKGHIDYILNGPGNEIITQMQFEMFCYNAEWNDFLTFDPRYPNELKGHTLRIERNDNAIKILEAKTLEIQTLIAEFIFDRNITLPKMEADQIKEELNNMEELTDYLYA